ncbi:acyl-CoA carboxylase epsilon subunit [Streptomyces odontomachi]|uniref:acyl-CoA carboxylase epsilon subunit n=1 Tax=Streptomyces odontomachi TaxID=2944940 RepID=UPI00210BC33A|nr:acyl-CoA carboxylase epsilon subunit [Streptomyces sp. ODS25]
MIKVVRGNPTPEELAAAVTVVQARAAAAAGAGADSGDGADGDDPAVRDAWADPARVARTRVPAPGPRAWGRTFWPG